MPPEKSWRIPAQGNESDQGFGKTGFPREGRKGWDFRAWGRHRLQVHKQLLQKGRSPQLLCAGVRRREITAKEALLRCLENIKITLSHPGKMMESPT